MKRVGALVALAALFGCKPASVQDAEGKGDVGYLSANGSPEAVAALGRLADKSDRARAALERRAETDLNAYIAAWAAVQRGAAWGGEVLRAGLRQPARAEMAATAMTRGDTKLAEFVNDLSNALVTAGAGEPRVTVASMLASTSAGSVVQQRLRDKTTRANMCRGLSSPDASVVSKQTFLAEPPESRDERSCIDAVTQLAALDDGTLGWLAKQGEPGLLQGAGKSDGMGCARLAKLWGATISARPVTAHASLAVPLAHAIKRCPKDLDSVLDGAIASAPALVVSAVDPYGTETRELARTCKAFASLRATGRTQDRAADALAHGCKGKSQR